MCAEANIRLWNIAAIKMISKHILCPNWIIAFAYCNVKIISHHQINQKRDFLNATFAAFKCWHNYLVCKILLVSKSV